MPINYPLPITRNPVIIRRFAEAVLPTFDQRTAHELYAARCVVRSPLFTLPMLIDTGRPVDVERIVSMLTDNWRPFYCLTTEGQDVYLTLLNKAYLEGEDLMFDRIPARAEIKHKTLWERLESVVNYLPNKTRQFEMWIASSPTRENNAWRLYTLAPFVLVGSACVWMWTR